MVIFTSGSISILILFKKWDSVVLEFKIVLFVKWKFENVFYSLRNSRKFFARCEIFKVLLILKLNRRFLVLEAIEWGKVCQNLSFFERLL